MAQFGGNTFDSFSVPLVFDGRYFVLEPGDPPLLTVFTEQDGEPAFEVLKNQPGDSDAVEISTNPTGVVTVSDKETGRFLYKVRPGSETSVVFGKIGGDEISCKVTDKAINVGKSVFRNNVFSGSMTGVTVFPDGGVGVGSGLPQAVRSLLSG